MNVLTAGTEADGFNICHIFFIVSLVGKMSELLLLIPSGINVRDYV
jgi:hypothetical protein